VRGLLLLFCALAALPAAGEDLGVRVILGLTDTSETKWDGTAAAQGANISAVDP